jgi:hypothetical protein
MGGPGCERHPPACLLVCPGPCSPPPGGFRPPGDSPPGGGAAGSGQKKSRPETSCHWPASSTRARKIFYDCDLNPSNRKATGASIFWPLARLTEPLMQAGCQTEAAAAPPRTFLREFSSGSRNRSVRDRPFRPRSLRFNKGLSHLPATRFRSRDPFASFAIGATRFCNRRFRVELHPDFGRPHARRCRAAPDSGPRSGFSSRFQFSAGSPEELSSERGAPGAAAGTGGESQHASPPHHGVAQEVLRQAVPAPSAGRNSQRSSAVDERVSAS